MNLAALSIRRPIFIACVITLLLIVGLISLKRLAVDLFPDVTIPIVTVTTTYQGAVPAEIEQQISKTLEDAISSVAGIDTLRSVNREGSSTIIIEFDLKVDIEYAEQQIRDRVQATKRRLPDDVDDPVVRTVDPADQPVLVVSLAADVSEAELYDLANETIKPQLSQVDKVGFIEILGGRKREIHVELDRSKLRFREIAANQVSKQLAAAGQNVPVGKTDGSGHENVYRAVGEFRSLESVANSIVRFAGNENPVAVRDLGRVVDTLEDEKSRTFVNGERALLMYVFRQSGANTVAVVDGLIKKVEAINGGFAGVKGKPRMTVVRDGAKKIRDNVYDVWESIIIGTVLTVLVVYLFLGSGRSTVITGLALPNSLLGACILMAVAGFSINIMTLLAMSLAVGLLIDDAIVVRENVFRHLEMGKAPWRAAYEGTREVTLAVVATTMAILAVFGPIGFLDGIIGQYLKEFGLTICFAMLISLFDALTIAPMLSAYFASAHETSKEAKGFILFRLNKMALLAFDRFQSALENGYERLLRGFVLRVPILVIVANIAFFVFSVTLIKHIPKTFLPAQDNGEFSVFFDLPPGTNLQSMAELTAEADARLRARKDVAMTVVTVGNRDGEANASEIFVKLVPRKQRTQTTSQVKDVIRQEMKTYAHANPQVGDSNSGGGGRPFNLNLIGADLDVLQTYAGKVLAAIKGHPALSDVDSSYRPGKPETQVVFNESRAIQLGVATATIGSELRTYVQGDTPAVFREGDREYDVRVRMRPEQRELRDSFGSIFVPNINGSMVPVSAVASIRETTGPATIRRENRARYIQISADVAPNGPGMGGAIADVSKLMENELKPPAGVTFNFDGQAKRFGELMKNMAIAMGLGVLFIYLVLCSLYESFVTPFAIMLVFPLAACGAFIALFLTGASLDLFSMIGCVMLLGLATKNSILVVDYATQLIQGGMNRKEAIVKAGHARLRPILMTSLTLIAGMVPVAVGLNEASASRTSLGIAIIGGTISSTLLTLLVVPAAFSYIDAFRAWLNRLFFRYIGSEAPREALAALGEKDLSEFDIRDLDSEFETTVSSSDALTSPSDVVNAAVGRVVDGTGATGLRSTDRRPAASSKSESDLISPGP